MSILKQTVTVLASSAAVLGVWASPAIAEVEPNGEQGAVASFEGRTIDLSKGWQDAQTCAVFSANDVRCYRDADTADKATGYNQATDPLVVNAAASKIAGVPSCADGWLCLYRYKNGEGRRLIFRDPEWQNLEQYGFNNMTSSWRNNQGSADEGWLAGGTNGAGWVLELDGKSYLSDMGKYDNDATSVKG